ncbi:NUDIX hydrolase [Streptomyces sp. NPDC048527]|uniref:NUDIX hydrolase n=1 Tax=Streptomyces sp. NPDC048527 TaxID=3365568 RepID=UPI0037192B05
MNRSVTDDHLHELVSHTHAEGIEDLAAAALIEHHGLLLLTERVNPNFDTEPSSWELPTGPIKPGETLLTGLERVLSTHFALELDQATHYLGHQDHPGPDGRLTRVFVFAATVTNPDAICSTAHIGHRWIDNIAISQTVPDINGLLRTYYADNSV